MKRISEEDFDLLKPQENHITKTTKNGRAEREHSPFNNTMYETFGKELEYVEQIAKKSPKRVWTILETDNNKHPLVITSGFHIINRHGYIITEIGVEEDTEVED